MAETWRKLKTFYYAHRDAIWRYGSACALVAVAWLTGSPALGMLGGLPLIAGYMSYEEWQKTAQAQTLIDNGENPHEWWFNNVYSSGNGDTAGIPGLEYPFMSPQMGMGFNVNVMSEAGQNSLQTFLQNVPGAKEFMGWYLPHIQSMMEAQPEAYPMGFDLGAGENEQRLMRMQMQRLGQIPDLASAYEGAYENYLPVYQRRYQENTLKPAQEQLAALGLEGSSAGMDYVGKLGEEQSITEAGLWQDMQLGKANAQQQMYNLEGAQLGAAWDMSGREAQRSYDTQRMEYADWLRQTGQQAEWAGMLGTPAYQSTLGAMTSVFNTGQSGAAGMQSSQMGANAGLMSSIYGTNMQAALAQQEMAFMQPYLNMANQPVQMSGGKK